MRRVPPSQLSRRGRSALFWALAAFAFCQFGMAVAIERACPQFRDPEFGYRRNRLLERLSQATPKPYTAVMLGSSRTTVGFDAGILERQLSEHLEAAGDRLQLWRHGSRAVNASDQICAGF